MNEKTMFKVNNKVEFVRLMGTHWRKVTEVSLLKFMKKGITKLEVKRHVASGMLTEIVSEEVDDVEDVSPQPISMVAPVPIPPQLQKRGRGRPRKNGS